MRSSKLIFLFGSPSYGRVLKLHNKEEMMSINCVCEEIAHLEYAIAKQEEQIDLLRKKLVELSILRDEKISKLRDKDQYLTQCATKKLAEFFYSHNMYIVDLHNGKNIQEHYAISKQIWNCRIVALPFIKYFYKNTKQTFSYDIKELSPSDKTNLLNICANFTKLGWLKFEQKKDEIVVSSSIPPQYKTFLNGGWAEEVNRYLIVKTLNDFTKAHPMKYKLFWDVKLKHIDSTGDNKNDMQLDFIVEVKDRFYIFETKSGSVLSIDKWVDRARTFNHDQHRFITCCADEHLNPMIFAPFRLLALPTLEKQFTDLLMKDFQVSVSE